MVKITNISIYYVAKPCKTLKNIGSMQSVWPSSFTEYNGNSALLIAIQGDGLHSVLSLIHPLKTLHACIPLRQMETFLKKISGSFEPELTPDPQSKWNTNQDGSSKNSCGSSNFPLVKDLAESIPKGQDGIDIAEFEACEVIDKETPV